MGQLKNNFTTPEQSKRLLEIGLPKWTADCYFDSWEQIQWRMLNDLDKDFFEKYSYIPSWSVGRLIEIWFIAGSLFLDGSVTIKSSLPERMIEHFEYEKQNSGTDFSKLQFD